MMKINTISHFREILNRVQNIIELRRYDNFTIAEYFRKQGAQIGDNCFIVPRQLGTEPYLVKLGNHVLIASGVTFHTHDGGTWIFREEIPWLRVFGPIIIEDNCIIGPNSQLLPNITIGKNTIVGAGSVVISDIPPNSLVMGIPARKMGSTDKYKEKCLERCAEQKPPNVHPDYYMHFWQKSAHKELLLSQLRMHLTWLFREKLK